MECVKSFGIVPFRKVGEALEVLLIQHKNGGHWGFPKGRAESGESPRVAAERELFEETGLQVVEWLRDTPLIEEYIPDHKQFRKQVSYFVAIVAGELQLQVAEVVAAEWMPLSQALDQLTFEESKNILRQYEQLTG